MLRYVERGIQLFKHDMASRTRKGETSRSRSAPPVLRSPSKIKKLKQWSTDSMTAAVDAVLVEQALLTSLVQALTLVKKKTF